MLPPSWLYRSSSRNRPRCVGVSLRCDLSERAGKAPILCVVGVRNHFDVAHRILTGSNDGGTTPDCADSADTVYCVTVGFKLSAVRIRRRAIFRGEDTARMPQVAAAARGCSGLRAR